MITECKECEALVDAQLVTTYECSDREDWPPGKILFLVCPNCQNPFLFVEENHCGNWSGPERLYPPEDTRINPYLPKPIRLAYGEALSCFKAKAFTATAIMCRKTLEGLCVEHGIVGRNLVLALKEMRDKGIIESRLYEWADALRISGNEAAHDVNITISAEDASDILDFTNALLEYIFTFRDKFEKFKQRRAHKSRT
jgi:hypothetical protein